MFTVVKFGAPFSHEHLWGVVLNDGDIITLRVISEGSKDFGKVWQIFEDDVIEVRVVDEL